MDPPRFPGRFTAVVTRGVESLKLTGRVAHDGRSKVAVSGATTDGLVPRGNSVCFMITGLYGREAAEGSEESEPRAHSHQSARLNPLLPSGAPSTWAPPPAGVASVTALPGLPLNGGSTSEYDDCRRFEGDQP